jgi:type VI secretion system secreted protein Hcp
MALYLYIPNKPGNVTAKGHEGWISIYGLTFNVKRYIATEPGRVNDRESTRPTISEILLFKRMDQSSPLIFSDACVGQSINEVKIDACQSGNQLIAYMQYLFFNVIISSYEVTFEQKSPSLLHTEYPVEKFSFSFDKLEMKYIPFDEKHNPQSPIPTGYDLREAILV